MLNTHEEARMEELINDGLAHDQQAASESGGEKKQDDDLYSVTNFSV